MDTRDGQPQPHAEQNARGRRIDREEVKVISQEFHQKVTCDAKGQQEAQAPAITLPRMHLSSIYIHNGSTHKLVSFQVITAHSTHG